LEAKVVSLRLFPDPVNLSAIPTRKLKRLILNRYYPAARLKIKNMSFSLNGWD
jgi:hypothetical protein